jgi:hypothetical protein
MRRLLLTLASFVVAMACWAAPAQGQAPSRDSVTGTAADFLGRAVPLIFDASSGPQGENPTGTVQIFFQTGSVTCLSVQGNRAVIGASWPLPPVPFVAPNLLIYVVDGGDIGDPPPDIIGTVPVAQVPTVCPAPGGHEDRFIFAGNITVVDAQRPLPTSKEQCKNGGWLSFPLFTNQGQCVAFVNHGGP